MNPLHRILSRALIGVWIANCSIACFIAVDQIWVPYMNAVSDGYTQIQSAPFDGTIMPIAYIPDWTKIQNQDKSKRFEDIAISEFLPIPLYDPLSLLDNDTASKASSISRYTYPAVYMGNYNLDYREHAGGHLGVDIRAPIGTPVLSIANGVVTRSVPGGDATGNKFIVIRHDNVPINGEKKTIYSGYLHLSEILVKEGDIVRKGDMIGRVGITGITTTPHLHFQIDTVDAPFHPYWHFTSSESKSAGVGFFEAVNIGLNKDKAEKYTIHPLAFVNTYLGGIGNIPIKTPPGNVTNTIDTPKPTTTIAAYVSLDEGCIGKRFSDVSTKSSFANILYPMVDKKCLFFEQKEVFGTKQSITFREALINTMRYFDISPASGTSHFLDIPIGDSLQGYALVAYRQGILTGNYAYPDYIMTREDIARLIVDVSGAPKNPSQMRIYSDVDTMNPLYQKIQDYGFLIEARGGKFYPKTLVSRGTFVQMLSTIK